MKVSAGYIALLAGLATRSSAITATSSEKPQLRQLQAKALESFGGDPPAARFPLRECQGDCDSDDHCAYGLVCYQKGSNRGVPGCKGFDASRTDFCIKDPNPSTSSGNNGASVLSIDVISAEEKDVSITGDEDFAAAETEQKSAASMMPFVPGVVMSASLAVIGLL